MNTHKHFGLSLLLGLLLLAVSGPSYAQTVDFVRSDNLVINPPAKILDYFRTRDWKGCQQACADDARCKAYTFVKPGGYQASDPPVCYLMSSLGPQTGDSCCISGLKRVSSTGSQQPSAPQFTLTATPNSVAPSGQVRVDFTAPNGHSGNDWIGCFRVGAPNTSYQNGTWFYTGGSPSYHYFTMPNEPGEYEFRYLLAGGTTEVTARSKTVQVISNPGGGGNTSTGSTCWEWHMVWHGGGVDQGTLRLFPDGSAYVQSKDYKGTTGNWKREAGGGEIWLDLDKKGFDGNYVYKFKLVGNKLTLKFPGNYYATSNGSEATQISCPAGQ